MISYPKDLLDNYVQNIKEYESVENNPSRFYFFNCGEYLCFVHRCRDNYEVRVSPLLSSTFKLFVLRHLGVVDVVFSVSDLASAISEYKRIVGKCLV